MSGSQITLINGFRRLAFFLLSIIVDRFMGTEQDRMLSTATVLSANSPKRPSVGSQITLINGFRRFYFFN